MTTPDVAAALARLRTHGRYPEMVCTAQPILDYRADLALVTQALADARAQAIEECAGAADRLARLQREEERVSRDNDESAMELIAGRGAWTAEYLATELRALLPPPDPTPDPRPRAGMEE